MDNLKSQRIDPLDNPDKTLSLQSETVENGPLPINVRPLAPEVKIKSAIKTDSNRQTEKVEKKEATFELDIARRLNFNALELGADYAVEIIQATLNILFQEAQSVSVALLNDTTELFLDWQTYAMISPQASLNQDNGFFIKKNSENTACYQVLTTDQGKPIALIEISFAAANSAEALVPEYRQKLHVMAPYLATKISEIESLRQQATNDAMNDALRAMTAQLVSAENKQAIFQVATTSAVHYINTALCPTFGALFFEWQPELKKFRFAVQVGALATTEDFSFQQDEGFPTYDPAAGQYHQSVNRKRWKTHNQVLTACQDVLTNCIVFPTEKVAENCSTQETENSGPRFDLDLFYKNSGKLESSVCTVLSIPEQPLILDGILIASEIAKPLSQQPHSDDKLLGILIIASSGANRIQAENKSPVDLSIVLESAPYKTWLTRFKTTVASAIERTRRLEMALAYASTDELTGLITRRVFYQRFESELERARRQSSSLCLALLDVDHFKQFNDTYGHLSGDLILKALAKQLTENIRRSDVLCRFGGEEFALVLSDTTLDDALQLMERIRTSIESMVVYGLHNESLKVTLSIGLTAVDSSQTTGESHQSVILSSLANADNALYCAKNAGRNRVSI
ncbi:MAG: GGDEF domain-containing protein [Cyanobacteria bacterium P01_H01_bin.74]